MMLLNTARGESALRAEASATCRATIKDPAKVPPTEAMLHAVIASLCASPTERDAAWFNVEEEVNAYYANLRYTEQRPTEIAVWREAAADTIERVRNFVDAARRNSGKPHADD